jgi:hypothetical protein
MHRMQAAQRKRNGVSTITRCFSQEFGIDVVRHHRIMIS